MTVETDNGIPWWARAHLEAYAKALETGAVKGQTYLINQEGQPIVFDRDRMMVDPTFQPLARKEE